MDRRAGDLLWDCIAKARNEEGEGSNRRFGKRGVGKDCGGRGKKWGGAERDTAGVGVEMREAWG